MIEQITAPLFVPATRPDRFATARQSGADAVIIDFEDAVAASEKGAARQILRRKLPELPSESVPLGVRTNSAATEHLPQDAALLAELAEHLDFLVLPEVEGVADLELLHQHLAVAAESAEGADDGGALPVMALIESSRGLLDAPAIADFPAVRRLALGAADLSAEWEVEPTPQEAEFDHARQHLVIASRAASLNGPLDTPHMNVRDDAGLAARMASAAQLGMKGKLCIHPRQVGTVRKTFVVSAEEHARLTELIRVFAEAEEAGNSSVRLDDGSFVDYPVYRRALKQVTVYEAFHGD